METNKDLKIFCPVCGSTELEKRVNKRKLGDRFTGTIEIEELIYQCEQCGAEGDFSNQNDKAYEDAIEAMSAKAMANMLKELNEKGIASADLERKLSLPQRTTARWKRDGASTAATTLMKAVITYPWLLEVASSNFDPNVANSVVVREGFKVVDNLVKSFHVGPNFVTTGINGVSGFEASPVFPGPFLVNGMSHNVEKDLGMSNILYRQGDNFFEESVEIKMKPGFKFGFVESDRRKIEYA